MRLKRSTDTLTLEIQDDGVGFDVAAVSANYDQRGSLGMINLHERAELLNGLLRIELDARTRHAGVGDRAPDIRGG